MSSKSNSGTGKGGVGYGNPPIDTRFKKGQSGNPKGRPRKSTATTYTSSDAQETIRKVLEEDIVVKRNGKSVKMKKPEAYLRTLESLSAKGNQGAAIKLIEMSLRDSEAKAQAYAQDCAFVESYRATREKHLKHCRDNNVPVNGHWIQDEDFILQPGRTLRIRGATSDEDVIEFEKLKWYRNLLILEITYNILTKPKAEMVPTIDIALIGTIAHVISTQDLVESNAFWDMVAEKSIISFNWLQEERKRHWWGIFNTDPPQSGIRFPVLPKKFWRLFH